jgi:hypothetical protein
MGKSKSKKIIIDNVVYVISSVVIVASICLVMFLPVSDSIRIYFSLPGIAGLFSLLVQGWRDQIAHERALEIQQKQHDFDLAVASHMANVVFDKQVGFCEEYTQKLYVFFQNMFRDGPSKDAIDCADELMKIRLKYSPWISLELINSIIPYEKALREIGRLSVLESQITGQGKQMEPGIIYRIDKVFLDFLGLNIEDQKEKLSAPDIILEHVRDLLDVKNLETIRHKAIRSADQSS